MSSDQGPSDDLMGRVDGLRRWVDQRAAAWAADRIFDHDGIRRAADIGLTGIEVPTELGGLGLGFSAKVRIAEVLTRASMAFAFSVINTQNVAARLATGAADRHRRELLPALLTGERLGSTALTEPGAGSDFSAITTTATRTDDGWRITGEKAWITNAALSDVIICYAQTDPGSGGAGIASFLIDGRRPGFDRAAPYELIGGHPIGTGGFVLDGYEAADDDLLTEPGTGFKSALAGVNGARIYVAAMCCSMVRSSLEVAVGYGTERQAFGRRLVDHQGLAWSLASVANRLEAAELLTARAVERFEADVPSEVVLAAAHAKKFATEMAEPAISTCIQAMGAEGLRDRYPLGRHLQEARIANYVDGSTEIQTDRIARSLPKVYRP